MLLSSQVRPLTFYWERCHSGACLDKEHVWTLVSLWSKNISCAAATGNDVCKEYNASHVAYDYAMRGEDWVTSPNKAWS